MGSSGSSKPFCRFRLSVRMALTVVLRLTCYHVYMFYSNSFQGPAVTKVPQLPGYSGAETPSLLAAVGSSVQESPEGHSPCNPGQ